MGMIAPVKTDYINSKSRAGRPACPRTLEIMGEIKVAAALGRVTIVMPLLDDEEESFTRFSARARNAARLCGGKVRVSRLGEGRGQLVLMEGDWK